MAAPDHTICDISAGRDMAAERKPKQTEPAEPEEELAADAVEAVAAEPIDVDEVVPPPRPGALAPLRDPVQRFLAEARRFERLSEDEERALGRAMREQGDMAEASKLIMPNLRLVTPNVAVALG